MKSDKQECSRR